MKSVARGRTRIAASSDWRAREASTMARTWPSSSSANRCTARSANAASASGCVRAARVGASEPFPAPREEARRATRERFPADAGGVLGEDIDRGAARRDARACRAPRAARGAGVPGEARGGARGSRRAGCLCFEGGDFFFFSKIQTPRSRARRVARFLPPPIRSSFLPAPSLTPASCPGTPPPRDRWPFRARRLC